MQPLILPYGHFVPQIDPSAWIAPGAVITGQTRLAAHVTVLYNCVIRGDVNRVEVGEGSNIQDLSMLHVADDWPCIIGREVTVGHCCIVHGCVVEDGCLIGMGARILNGARIGRGSIVAAGAVVPEGMQVPPGSLVAGVPAQVKSEVTQRHLERLGALEGAAQDPTIPEDLRGLPGVAFARKYRLVAKAYRDGHAYRGLEGQGAPES
ncbi:gamma carbonic anhydrase family protein [bacterium]|nr:gamma carbonic anhydrase family protein [bacterium]